MSASTSDQIWEQIRLADYALDERNPVRAQCHLAAALRLAPSLNTMVNNAFYASEWLSRVVRLAEMQNERRT